MAEARNCYTVNQADVAAKVIDGELIIIRLSDGTYYSMDNVGTQVWELIQARLDLPSVIRTISAWYGAPADQVESEIEPLIDELLSERLIVAAATEGAAGPPVRPDGLPAYERPQLHVYRDMGNLLALDPPTPGIDDLLFREGNAV